jgi:hypothetical protein
VVCGGYNGTAVGNSASNRASCWGLSLRAVGVLALAVAIPGIGSSEIVVQFQIRNSCIEP